jgi:hypothetical protein
MLEKSVKKPEDTNFLSPYITQELPLMSWTFGRTGNETRQLSAGLGT